MAYTMNPPSQWVRRVVRDFGGEKDSGSIVSEIWFKRLSQKQRKEIINKGGSEMARRRRRASAAQLRALAKGRATLARRRRGGGSAPRRRRSARRRSYSLSGGTRSRARSVGRGVKRLTRGLMSPLMDALLGSSGAVVAGILANLVPVTDKRVKALIPLGAGVLVASMIPDKRVKMVGVGMAIAGTISTIKQWVPGVPILAGDDVLLQLPDYLHRPGQTMAGVRRLAGVRKLAGPVHVIPGKGERFRTMADM